MEQVVFTTKSVMFKGAPVLEIYHDTDGEWQFYDAGPVEDEDVLIISLKNILEKAKDLDDIVESLQEGFWAFRKDLNEPWKIEQIERNG